MKIGIFGGCFNPPHRMHRRIALELLDQKILDKVIFVPTGNKYNKQDLASDDDRYTMLKLMDCDYSNIEVSKHELGSTLIYTYQTLDYFKKIYANDIIYFITGEDNLKEIETWKNYEYILKHYKLLIIRRGNNRTLLLNKKLLAYKDNIIYMAMDLDDVSSTLVRGLIHKECKNLSEYIDDNVRNYIALHHLYK